ncbi:MAG: SulP family inorganic anion transporter [Candidatus Anammoxibacter sp.]
MIDLIFKQKYNLKNDLLSGLTVSFALIPEAVAFAFVAGVDPAVGLWAAFFVGFITSTIGGRPGMISGATGAMAVVMTAFIVLYGLEYLFAAVILCGIIQILCGVFKLGKFVRLLPLPVMFGFVNGLAIVIAKAQFSQLKENHRVIYNSAIETFEVVGEWITGTNLIITISILVATMSIIHFLPKLTKVVPATLIAIIAMTLLTQLSPIKAITVKDFVDTQKKFSGEKKHKTKYFNEIKENLIVSDVDSKAIEIAASNIQIGEHKEIHKAGRFMIPDIKLSWETITIIFGLAITLAAIGLIESLMTLTLIDELTETRGRSNRECVGQGIANIVSGFFGSMGGCAMIGQSMINISSGGRGRLSGISSAVFLLCFIVFPPLWQCIEMIPVATLIGVMFIVVIGTFEWTSLRLWNKIPKSDFMIIVVVSAMTVLHDLAVAVATGVIISALVFAWKKSQQIHAVIKEENGTKTYTLKGPLFFGATRTFKGIFTPTEDPDNVIIEFMNTRVYDHSAIGAINSIGEKYKELGKKLHIKHLSKECQALLEKAGDIVEIDIHRDPDYHIATNQLD